MKPRIYKERETGMWIAECENYSGAFLDFQSAVDGLARILKRRKESREETWAH